MNDYILFVQERLKKMPKSKAISYLKGALMVDGDTKNTKALKSMMKEVTMWEE